MLNQLSAVIEHKTLSTGFVYINGKAIRQFLYSLFYSYCHANWRCTRKNVCHDVRCYHIRLYGLWTRRLQQRLFSAGGLFIKLIHCTSYQLIWISPRFLSVNHIDRTHYRFIHAYFWMIIINFIKIINYISEQCVSRCFQIFRSALSNVFFIRQWFLSDAMSIINIKMPL